LPRVCRLLRLFMRAASSVAARLSTNFWMDGWTAVSPLADADTSNVIKTE
jgi:hypothetical protein